MADISKITLPSGSEYDIKDAIARNGVGNSRVWYASCSTAAGTKTKTISLAGLTSLTVGDQFVVYFANAQTYNGAPALQVNEIPAAGIRRLGGTNTQRYEWSAGEILHFVWNGSYFVIVDAGLASTTYFGYVKLSSAVNSTSEALAATPKAVKLAYDKAPPTFTNDDNGKRLMIVDGAMQWSESEGDNLLGLSVNTLKAAESGTIVSLTVNQLVAKT